MVEKYSFMIKGGGRVRWTLLGLHAVLENCVATMCDFVKAGTATFVSRVLSTIVC